MGLISTLIYTSELTLCSTICVHSATRHNIHMTIIVLPTCAVRGKTVNGRAPGFSPSSAIFFSLFAVSQQKYDTFHGQEEAVLKIDLLGKGLTQGIRGDRGSV